jgi:hexosaminidase
VLSDIRLNLSFRLTLCLCVGSLCSAHSMSAQSTPADSSGFKLIPQPREISHEASLPLTHGIRIALEKADAEDTFTAHDLEAVFAEHSIAVTQDHGAHPAIIELLRTDSTHAQKLLHEANLSLDGPAHDEGYVILPTHEGLACIGATSSGLFYAAQTIKQLILGNGTAATLHTAEIRDWPAMRYRGQDDDLSRGPIPTLEYQKRQIRTFAAYKLNVYSPYFENTFHYESNPLPGLPDGAMTAAEYTELAKYAQQYHIIVIPEQEAFGHLHNVLIYDKYADLAETPHGSVLAPGNPAALPLIKQWFTELAAATPGPFVHIGADETFDLGKGKTHDEVQKRGLGAVYIDFLKQISTTLEPLNKRILFWGDVAMNEPKLVPQLPKSMIAVPWTYDPDPKGFDRYILPFKEAGMETWVAPGVNNWNRVYPDNNMALGNIQGFVRDGQRLSSTGMLNTVWNDDGEGLFDQDWYGVLFGAAASWQPGESSIPLYESSYGEAFHGDTTGSIDEAQREMMAAHALLAKTGDGAAFDNLFWVDPWSADGQELAKTIRPVERELRLHAEHALELIAKARQANSLREPNALAALELGARRIDAIGLKFEFADEIVDAYARAQKASQNKSTQDDVDSALYEITDTNGRCQDLRSNYSLIRDLYEQAWLKENRPYWLHNVLVRYDLSIELWTLRGNRFAEALSQWHRDHKLPSPESLGIPAKAS